MIIRTKINAVTILDTAIHGHPFLLEIGKKYQGKTITEINSVIGFYGVGVEYNDKTIDEFINVPYILHRKELENSEPPEALKKAWKELGLE